MGNAYDVVNRNGESLIKLISTINGGAAVAMLGFAEKLMEITGPATVGFSLKCYVLGVTLAVGSHGFMNLFLMADGDPKWSNSWFAKMAELLRLAAYACGTAGIAAFVAGSWSAATALAFQ